jgi:hypothetical protein
MRLNSAVRSTISLACLRHCLRETRARLHDSSKFQFLAPPVATVLKIIEDGSNFAIPPPGNMAGAAIVLDNARGMLGMLDDTHSIHH